MKAEQPAPTGDTRRETDVKTRTMQQLRGALRQYVAHSRQRRRTPLHGFHTLYNIQQWYMEQQQRSLRPWPACRGRTPTSCDHRACERGTNSTAALGSRTDAASIGADRSCLWRQARPAAAASAGLLMPGAAVALTSRSDALLHHRTVTSFSTPGCCITTPNSMAALVCQ